MGPVLIAVETATATTGVALWRDGALVGEALGAGGRPTAETLLPALDALLDRCGVELAAVDGFAVSIGPGSFTGLRIGLATVKGLAFGTACRAVAVPSLAVLAAGAPPGPGPAVAVLDARRGEVYAAAYGDDPLIPGSLLPEGVYPASALAALPPGCRFVGEGLGPEDSVRAVLPLDASVSPAAPRAADVARLGARLWEAGAGVDAADLVPRYVRRAEAEVKRTGERFEPSSRL